ncbi:MAG TPA: 3-keto-5-aminohexanoate cleavage protein, partial [Dehalococcoidales bacterium]|nr:3-keto-5-aminohexanoate cleavage protein [Dehalococcoidales bacterium]
MSEERVLRKVIITAAITGQGATPIMSEFLPLTPKQIADDAVKAYQAGAAIVHIHARKAENGEPTPSLPIFREIVTDIKKRCNVVINITTGGAGTPDERIKVVPEFKPEMATLNCGSLSGTSIQTYEKNKDKIKYEWEKKFLAREEFIFENTYKMMRKYSQACRENNTRPEIEIWDIGQISAVKFMLDRNYITAPVHLQFVMGAL